MHYVNTMMVLIVLFNIARCLSSTALANTRYCCNGLKLFSMFASHQLL